MQYWGSKEPASPWHSPPGAASRVERTECGSGGVIHTLALKELPCAAVFWLQGGKDGPSLKEWKWNVQVQEEG